MCFQYINWLQTQEPKFRQNHMDSFHIETLKLGLLQKILIGHDHVGYGMKFDIIEPSNEEFLLE